MSTCKNCGRSLGQAQATNDEPFFWEWFCTGKCEESYYDKRVLAPYDNPHSDLAFYLWHEFDWSEEEPDELLFCLDEGVSYMTFGVTRPYGNIEKLLLVSFDEPMMRMHYEYIQPY